MLTTKTKKGLSRKKVEERIRNICADVAKKKMAISQAELKAIIRKYKFPVKALGALHTTGGYLKSTTTVSLTKRGLEASEGKFKKRRR